jgi:septal ring factor EnvC (AmiA/AmiB activator)
MFLPRHKTLALAFLLLPLLAGAQSVKQAQSLLAAAEQAAAMHKQAAAAAQRQARQDAAEAALLAEQEVQSAARLRQLEAETGGAAGRFASLQAQFAAASHDLKINEAALTGLLPVMQRLSAQPGAILLAAPGSPVDSVRGVLILQGIVGEIEQKAELVRAQTANANDLLRKMTAQQIALTNAVAAEQKAEAALNAQIAAARTAEAADADVAAREAADALKGGKSVASLRAMIGALQRAAPLPAGPGEAGISPVAGDVVQNFGDPTVAGPATGLIYHAAPGARVVAPCAGPVLFADRFQSYGLLVIIGCSADYDFVLSGMTRLNVAAGQRLARGQPVGVMLGYDAKNPGRQPSLYVELRQNGTPVDPANWLTGGGSG